ncbi:MAG: O-antigen ligase family protein [Coriobacteriia bacterium]|nr:O-antigen ligase family protein [Coriobacteriia bacterium]
MKAPDTQSPGRRFAAVMLPLALVLVWVGDAVAQRFNAPTLGSEFMAAALAIPLFAWALTRLRLDRERIQLLAVASLPVLLMLITSLRTASPAQALLGGGPMWQGWVLWACALGWFWVAVAAADGRDLMRVVRVLVWLGSLAALWTLFESAGLFATYQERSGAAAMALFDSPNSLGQVLTLTIAATVSLALRKNQDARVRLGYILLALLQFSAILAAGSRAALLGIVIGVAAYGILESGHTGPSRAVRLVSAAALALFGVGFGVVSAAWSGILGPDAFSRVDQLLSGRFAIWNHAGERLVQYPLMGAGPGSFDSIITWDVMADGTVGASLTYDQHSILLTWLMGAGLLGLAAFGLAATVLGLHIVRSVEAAHSSASVRVLAAGGVALFVAMLSSWPEPLALLSVSLIVGCLITSGSLRGSSPKPSLSWRSPVVAVPVTIAAVATLISLAALVPAVNARLLTARAENYPELISRIERALSDTDDYSYLTSELTLIQRRGSLAVPDSVAVDMLRKLAADYPPEATGRVEIPLLALDILYQRAGELSAEEYWGLSRFYAEKGIEASPSEGVWKYALARAAYTTHRSDTASYVDDALASGLPQSAAIFVRQMR